jgi:hypothetical protein
MTFARWRSHSLAKLNMTNFLVIVSKELKIPYNPLYIAVKIASWEAIEKDF